MGSTHPWWQLEASCYHALDREVLVERLPTQRRATDLQPNLCQLQFAGIAQAAKPIGRKSHDPLVRQLAKTIRSSVHALVATVSVS